jgi:Domain of unknown function (DUF4349)
MVVANTLFSHFTDYSRLAKFIIPLSTSCQLHIKHSRLLLATIKAEYRPNDHRRRIHMNTKRLFTTFALLVVVLAVSACAAKEKSPNNRLASQGGVSAEKIVTQVVEKPGEVVVQIVKATAPAAGKPVEAPYPGQGGEGSQDAASGDVALLNYQSGSVRMVIKDAEIELEVEDTDRAIDQVTQLAADYGGYLISSHSWYDGELKYASIRLAVPSQAFETALTNLRHFGVKVIKETGSGQDVSAEYTDLQSRLTNLEATAARVREFLNAAKTVEESLKVNQQLSELESQIEQIKGQMKYYEGRSAFSTITVDLTPQHPTPATPTPTPTATPTATPTPRPGWNPSHTFQNASGVLSTLVRTTVDLVIWLAVVFGPFLAILLILYWLLNRILRGRIRARADRRAMLAHQPAPTNPENPAQ